MEEYILDVYRPIPTLLRKLDPLSIFGVCKHKKTINSLQCLALLSERFAARILVVIRQHFDEKYIMSLLSDYSERAEDDEDLQQYADILRSKLEKCDVAL